MVRGDSGGGQVVPAVDGSVRERQRRTGMVAGGLQLAVVDSFQQPVGKQWGHRLGEPLAEPQVAHPVAAGGRCPGDRVGQRGHRPGLQQPQPAVSAAGVGGDCPFQVLRGGEVGVDAAGERGDLAGLVGGDRLLGRPRAVGVAVADDPLVTGGLAGHQPLTQPADGGDDDLVTVAGQRVGSEGDPGRVGRHHDLHQDRHPGAGPGRFARGGCGGAGAGMNLAVGGDARRGARVEHSPHRVGQLVETGVQDGLVLTRKRRARKVLGAG
jgi:hypothetical protein